MSLKIDGKNICSSRLLEELDMSKEIDREIFMIIKKLRLKALKRVKDA